MIRWSRIETPRGVVGDHRRKKKKEMSKTVTGTSYFVSLQAAIRYYTDYGYDNVAYTVGRKIKEGEIHIGRPVIDESINRLVILDGGLRYGLEEV